MAKDYNYIDDLENGPFNPCSPKRMIIDEIEIGVEQDCDKGGLLVGCDVAEGESKMVIICINSEGNIVEYPQAQLKMKDRDKMNKPLRRSERRSLYKQLRKAIVYLNKCSYDTPGSPWTTEQREKRVKVLRTRDSVRALLGKMYRPYK